MSELSAVEHFPRWAFPAYWRDRGAKVDSSERFYKLPTRARVEACPLDRSLGGADCLFSLGSRRFRLRLRPAACSWMQTLAFRAHPT